MQYLQTPKSPLPWQLLTPRTNSTRASTAYTATCIFTPESSRRPEAPGGLSDNWPGESEMELALELVNHVEPNVADRLIERLRTAESSRLRAEERLRRAEERYNAAKAAGESGLQRQQVRQGCLVLSLLLALLVALAVVLIFGRNRAVAGSIGAMPSEQSSATFTPQSVVEAADGQDDEEAFPDEAPAICEAPGTTADDEELCEAVALEARAELQELQDWNAELQAGYGKAVAAVSDWVRFLKEVWGSEGLDSQLQRQHGLSHGALEAHCIQSALPGRLAMEELARSVVPPSPRSRGRKEAEPGLMSSRHGKHLKAHAAENLRLQEYAAR